MHAIKYRPDIDGLRAIAVLSVVFFHAFPAYLTGGFVGVDIFFVISGYLIYSIIHQNLRDGQFSIALFYQRRIRRIFPALLTVVGLSLAAGYYLMLPDEMQALGKHSLGAATFLSNFVLWNESGYFDADIYLKPLMHLWSLAVEEQFYLVVPLLLGLTWKRMPPWALLGVLVLASFAYSVYATGMNASAAFFSPLSRFWEIGAGCLAGFVMSHAPARAAWSAFVQQQPQLIALGNALAAAGLVWSCVFVTDKMPFPGWVALPAIASTVFLILSFESQSWVHKLLSLKPMVAVGLISYPLYLWHWPILSFLHILYGGMPPVDVLAYAVAGAFVGATLTYFAIEKPIRFAKPGSWLVPGVLLVLMLGVAAVGYHYFAPEKVSQLVTGKML
ncbi:MAG: acyltransferase family protein [Brachymonas sp.]